MCIIVDVHLLSVICYGHDMANLAQKILDRLNQDYHVGKTANECFQIIIDGKNVVQNFYDELPSGDEFFIRERDQKVARRTR